MESSSSSSFAASSSTQVVSQTETKSAKSIGEYHQINYYFLPSDPVKYFSSVAAVKIGKKKVQSIICLLEYLLKLAQAKDIKLI